MPTKKKLKPTHLSTTSPHLPAALVAGAAGFIGSHLCEALLHQNCRVYAIDNWTTGKKQNIKPLLSNDQFVFIEHDLNKPFKTSVPQVDYIFHLAGVEAYLNGLDVSLETLLINSLGTKELLEVAKKQQAKFLMASTTDIFSGYISSSDLAHYFGDSHVKEEAYSHHEAKRFSEALTFEYLNRHQVDARIVRLGNVYGPRMDLKAGNQITKLLVNLIKDKPLQITGQGLTQLYPTYISDIIYGLTKAMFSQSSSSHIFTLVNPTKTTVLNFAYKLKEALPSKDLKIEFVADQEDTATVSLTNEVIKSQSDLGWTPKVNLKEGIEKTLAWLKKGDLKLPKATSKVTSKPETPYTPEELGISPVSPVEPPSPKKIKSAKKPLFIPKSKFNFKFKRPTIKLSLKPKASKLTKKTKLIFLGLLLLFLYLTTPIVLMAGFAYSGFNSLNLASQLTDLNNLNQLTSHTTSAQKNFTRSRSLLRRSQIALKLVGLKSLTENLDRLLYIGTKLSLGAVHLSKAGESGTLLTGIVFHHQDGNLTEAINRIKLNLDQAYAELSFVDSELQSGKQLDIDLTTNLTQKFVKLTSNLPTIRQKIDQVRSILPLMPGFIAEDSKKTYLLLFQNSAELRPTGGFIGSYGLLTFEKGKLLDFSVEDIYAADGQLKGYVEPPEPIKEAFGDNSWFFRDSNWDPAFPISAQRAEWFLQKTTNRNVDGVIAVNLPAVRELLKATGTITLTDYNEEVTADNLFERAEYHSEIDFFPGSTQKKDFLGALAGQIFDKAQNSSAADLLLFAQSLETSLTQKQLLIYLHDPQSQQLLLDQNWAGAIYTPKLATLDNRPVTLDYTYLVDANLGVNKANYFLHRNLQQQLTILKNKEILAVSTLTIENRSPADAWPGGIYRSYLRNYLPKEADIISIKLGEDKLDLEGDLDQEIIGDHLVIGFDVVVPVKNSLDIEITYRLPDALKLNNNQGRLAVVIPKQPGIVDDTIETIVSYPSFLTVAAVQPQALSSPQVVTFNSDMTQDRVFTIDFIER